MQKILFLGPEVSDFINPLAGKLKELGYVVDLLENRKVHRNNDAIVRSYSNVINYTELTSKRLSILKAFKYLFSIELYKKIIKTLFFNCIAGNLNFVKSLRNSFSYQYTKEIFAKLFSEYDVISFHSLNTPTLIFVDFVSPKTKVILSYWGSDLFQIWGEDIFTNYIVNNHYIESQALKRADIITVPSHEMERAVIAKFGSVVQSKIIHLLFGVDDEFFNRIDRITESNSNEDFNKKFNIPENKIKIKIGYCGNPICNHLPTLEELTKLDQNIKDRMHLLVPMTYGRVSQEYHDEVILKLKESDITYTIFESYLSSDEVVKLRIVSDIMIMMNKSDALSFSVREALYAENLLISAMWLPYSPYRLAGIYFYETDFDRLNERVIYAVNNFDQIKSRLSSNPAKMRKLTILSEILPGWINVFNEAKSN